MFIFGRCWEGKFFVMSLTRGLFLDTLAVFVTAPYEGETTLALWPSILPVSNNGLVPIFKFIIITKPKTIPLLLASHPIFVVCLLLCCDDNIIMIINCMRLLSLARPMRYSFAAVTKDQVNYYNVLEVDQSATENAIRAAYAELTKGIIPELDGKRFKELSEAFVILTDLKTRDAYDSLLKVRKTHYLSPEEEETRPATRSLLSLRRQDKLEQLKAKLNIDEFGRYKGGLPQKYGQLRGTSRAEIGSMHRARQIEEQLDPEPEFNNVTAEKAESFKDFHQDERVARQMKWPWFSFQVDYDFLTFGIFRKKYWPKLQFFILVFYIIPTLYYAITKFQKQQATQELKEKALKKAEGDKKSQERHAA